MAATYYYPATAIRVCVDEINDSCMRGRAYCAQLDEVLNFCDINELVLGMEAIFDERGCPEPFQRKRSFIKKGVIRISPEDRLRKQAIMREKRTIPQNNGKLATLLVYVMSRRDNSWQGRVEWVDDGEISVFNSALEFLRIINTKLVRGEALSKKAFSE